MTRVVTSLASVGAILGLVALIGQPTSVGDAYVCYKGAAVRAPFLPAAKPSARVGTPSLPSVQDTSVALPPMPQAESTARIVRFS